MRRSVDAAATRRNPPASRPPGDGVTAAAPSRPDVDPTQIRRYAAPVSARSRELADELKQVIRLAGRDPGGARGRAARAVGAAPRGERGRARRARARAPHPAPADPRVPRPAAGRARLPRDPRAHDVGGRRRRDPVADDALPQGRGAPRQRRQRLRSPPGAATAGRVRAALHRARPRGPARRAARAPARRRPATAVRRGRPPPRPRRGRLGGRPTPHAGIVRRAQATSTTTCSSTTWPTPTRS